MLVQFANLKVTSPTGEVLFDNIYRLPVTIGRHSNATISIPDAPADMSRIHVRLSESDDGVVLSDESTLGTEYHGEVLSRDTRLLGTSDEFSFRGYHVAVSSKMPVEGKQIHAEIHLKNSQGKNLLTEGGNPYPPIAVGQSNLICLRDRDEHIKFEAVPMGAVKGNLFGSYNLSDMDAIFIIGKADTTRMVLLASEYARDFNLLLNRSPVEVGRQYVVKPYDLVEISGLRLEIVEQGGSALRCSNEACERLNKYEPQGNCSWCGHRLVLAHTAIIGSK